MRSVLRVIAAVSAGMGLSACGGGVAAKAEKQAPEKTVSLQTAQALSGPFADVAGFCAQLGQPACEANEQVLMLLSSHKEALTTRAGQKVKLVSAASRDGGTQHGHLLLSIDGKLWAMPPVLSYDPSGGRRISAATMRFAQDDANGGADDAIVLALNSNIEQVPGGEVESREFNVYCKVGPKPACLRVDTAIFVMDGLDTLNPVKGASALVISTGRGTQLEVSDLGRMQLGDKFDPTLNAKLLAEGIHGVKYP